MTPLRNQSGIGRSFRVQARALLHLLWLKALKIITTALFFLFLSLIPASAWDASRESNHDAANCDKIYDRTWNSRQPSAVISVDISDRSIKTAEVIATENALAVPPTPTNTSPGSTSSPGPTTASSSVTLSWSASSGATYYGLGVRDLSTNLLVVDTNVTGTSYTASLSAGKPYRWNVNACNSAGCSGFTTVLYFQTPTAATLPDAPQNLAAFGGNGQNGLAWNAPSSNGGAAITSYRVFRGTTSSNRQIVTSGGCANLGAVLGCTDTGLTNGQTYYYIVSAVNSVGQGPPSNSATATPSTGSAPGSFTLSNNAPVCDTNAPIAPAVRLNWTTSSGATSYDLFRNGSLYSAGLTGTTFYNNANLVAGQTYTYFVRARNSAGSADSNTVTVLIPSNICSSTPPPTINSINPSNVVVNQVTVLTVNGSNFQSGFGATVTTSLGTFSIASAGLTFINSGQVLVQVTMGGTPPLSATLKITNPDGQSTTGNFQVVASSSTPGAFTLSNQVPVCDTNAPVAPAVRLNWTASSGATSYDLYRNGSLYSSGLTGTTFYNSANVVAGHTYTYFVQAKNASDSTDYNESR